MITSKLKTVSAALLGGAIGGAGSGMLLGFITSIIIFFDSMTASTPSALPEILPQVFDIALFGMLVGLFSGITFGLLSGLLFIFFIPTVKAPAAGIWLGSIIGFSITILFTIVWGWDSTQTIFSTTLPIIIAGTICGTVGGRAAGKIMLHIAST